MSILVLDIGSSSARALLFSDSLDPVSGPPAPIHHQLITDSSGMAVLDPLSLRTSVEALIDAVLLHPDSNTIRAVIMATLVGNVLGIDPADEPLTPIMTYADTRCADLLIMLEALIDPQEIYQRTGCRIHSAYQPARLYWIQKTQPDLFKRVARWVDLGTYLYTCWFGEAACSYSVAAWSGMLNRQLLTWDDRWLDVLGMTTSQLPALADYHEAAQGLCGEYADRWKPLAKVPFYLAVGDGAAANVGSGCIDSDHIALTLGTTGALRTVHTGNVRPVPSGLWSYRIDRSHHLIGGATTEGGSIAAWLEGTFGIALPEVEAQLEKREPDSHGLTFLPLLAGERSPGWNANATGTIHGLRLSTSASDIAQAALEGVAHRLALIGEQVNRIASADAVVIGGGGALVNSRVWGQMIADALNRPIQITEEREITARGAAALALHALNGTVLEQHPPSIDRIITPRPEAVEKMKAARHRQQELYERLYQR